MTSFYLGEDETADIVARDQTELLRLVLPDLAGVEMRLPAQVEAAE